MTKPKAARVPFPLAIRTKLDSLIDDCLTAHGDDSLEAIIDRVWEVARTALPVSRRDVAARVLALLLLGDDDLGGAR